VNGNGSAVELSAVARRSGRRWVLRGADLTLQRGEAIALMGRNGSGKTTLLRVIATLLRPTRGSGYVLGFDLIRNAPEVRHSVGLLGHHAGLYEDLTPRENLRFSLEMAGRPFQPSAVDGALEKVGLAAERDERVRGFSAGMRRRLALARLFLRPPRLLMLDEPYAAFDPAGVELVNGFVGETVRNGGSVIVVTHDLARARASVQRVLRIEDGRILAGSGQTSPDEDAVSAAESR